MIKSTFKCFIPAILTLCLLVSLGGCKRAEPEYIDPYAGMVSVSDGKGGQMWVKLHEELAQATFKAEDFAAGDGVINYIGEEYEALCGIDVSEHQGEIDWAAVRGQGVDFAIIRAGYRGYSEGELFEDAYFRRNIEGATAQGMKVGVYFFSQAITATEAREEAQYLLGLLEGYDISLPIYFDWEPMTSVGEARTQGLDSGTLTDCALAFSQVITEAGFDAGVYFFRSLAYFEYELERLSGLRFWVGAVGDYPDFYYRHDLWQYSFTANVLGIEGAVDLNIMFSPKTQNPPAPSIAPGEIPPPEVSMAIE